MRDVTSYLTEKKDAKNMQRYTSIRISFHVCDKVLISEISLFRHSKLHSQGDNWSLNVGMIIDHQGPFHGKRNNNQTIETHPRKDLV